MLLPTAACPSCRRDVVVYRTVAEGSPDGSALETRCLDCDTRLDRFGQQPQVTERGAEDLEALGYRSLDKVQPIAKGGCFETRGCEGCSKIDSRPW